MISEKVEIIDSITTQEKGLYSREENELLYPLEGGREEVEMIKVELGSYAFAAQYQQNPLPLSSGIIKQEWLKHYKNFPDNLSHVTQSLDTAVSTNDSSDFNVCTTWAKIDNIALFTIIRTDRNMLLACYSHK
ncbi:hypothetical protein OZD68_00070, partial [Wolbachia endosymbiont of Drosophila bicornuta]|nr:hypothetical protein [Wolbachia endosymbiont of Drosophila bicornuta]